MYQAKSSSLTILLLAAGLLFVLGAVGWDSPDRPGGDR